MNNMEMDSVSRMRELYNYGKDLQLKPNVSETIEYKVDGPDGKKYGIVRENRKYFIKESNDGVKFEYIGGIGNRNENEYLSYNSAFRNLELKMRSLNESLNNGKVFEPMAQDTNSEYIIEATKEMRDSINRQLDIMTGASKIMNEKNEFINKPKFKDPESFGTATDPKKQGEPFEENPGEYKGDIDPKSSNVTPENAGDPFETNVKPAPEKMDIEKTNKKPCEAGKFGEPAKDVLGNSVAAKKPSGNKIIKVTEAQMAEVRKKLSEGFYDDDDYYVGDEDESDLLKQFNYDLKDVPKYAPSKNDLSDVTDDYTEDNYDVFDPNKDLDVDSGEGDYAIDDEYPENEGIEEGFGDTLKSVGSVGKYFGGKAINKAKDVASNIGSNIKSKAKSVGQEVSQRYNMSQQNISAEKIQQIANNLKAEIDNLNARTIKAGGQPINYQSVIATISNQLRGNKGVDTSRYRAESFDRENFIKELTEAVLNAFGQHPTYQKPAFTTPASSQSLVDGTKEWDDESAKGEKPYGQKIGDSAPFSEPVKQKVGEGEIGEDSDSVMQGKTPQGLPKLGNDGDKQPFKKEPQKNGDKIAKGTPVQQGETQQGKPNLGQKGDVQPFGDKKLNKNGVKESIDKAEFLSKLAESIINDLKKK